MEKSAISGYRVSYCCVNIKGGIRENNQDNFYVHGSFRAADEKRSDIICCGTILPRDNELMAVYDGMGGEACGEIASLIAAVNTSKLTSGSDDANEVFTQLCECINREICDYAKLHGINCMGTTAAVMLFTEKRIYVCNLGDSRIYEATQKGISQISQDHVLKGHYEGKAPITQFLGAVPEDVVMVPYIVQGSYQKGSRFIVCSDGITDALSDGEIYSIAFQQSDVQSCAKNLVSAALKNGGRDNITVILCEIQQNK